MNSLFEIMQKQHCCRKTPAGLHMMQQLGYDALTPVTYKVVLCFVSYDAPSWLRCHSTHDAQSCSLLCVMSLPRLSRSYREDACVSFPSQRACRTSFMLSTMSAV